MNENYLLLFFPLAITLHNVEEALWLPQWSKQAGRFHRPVGTTEFHFAVLIITAMAYLATFLMLVFPNVIIVNRFFYGFLGAMTVNVLFPHLAASIFLRTYAPGLLTGLLLNVPIGATLIYQAVSKNILTFPDVIGATIIVGLVLIALIPLLFRLGQMLIKAG
ncbi:MAG: HXXEE domain-containing protein [Smithellaceae bacterium]